ncbi:MAG: hypothetical protein ABJQ37_13705 [Reichenbachiella sp.]|uniref:hypothetical protein n=3 Tax=Reichenbachiella sp. TaxID=2184521 RepID=UPI0032991DBB
MKPVSEILFSKKVLALLLICVAIFFINGCGGDESSDPEPSRFTLMTNSNDPQFLSVEATSGELIEVFGTRNNFGAPEQIDQIIVKGIDQKEQVYFLDDQGRPNEILTDNGTKFSLEWLSETDVALTILSPDGSTQINTEIDLLDNSSGRIQNVDPTNGRTQRNNILSATYTSKSMVAAGPTNTESSDGTTVNVFQCGVPKDADVYVDVETTNGSLIRRLRPIRISEGVYSTKIPNELASTIEPDEICKSVKSVLDNICMASQIESIPLLGTRICAQLSIAVGSTGVGSVVAGQLFAACEALTFGMELYCSTLGASAAPGAPSLADELCNAEFLDYTITEDIVLKGVVIGLPNNIYSEPQQVSGNGPYPELYVNLGSETVISGFILEPSIPQPNESYRAIAKLFCLEVGTEIDISIVGSDGYTNSTSYFVSSADSYGEYELNVPGALEGVEDVCTLQLKMLDGTTLTRTASLVFGGGS